MAIRTMGRLLSKPTPSLSRYLTCRTTPDVLSMSDRLQMIRVDAAFVEAASRSNMVELHPFRYRSMKEFPGHYVCLTVLASHPELPVTVGEQPGGP